MHLFTITKNRVFNREGELSYLRVTVTYYICAIRKILTIKLVSRIGLKNRVNRHVAYMGKYVQFNFVRVASVYCRWKFSRPSSPTAFYCKHTELRSRDIVVLYDASGFANEQLVAKKKKSCTPQRAWQASHTVFFFYIACTYSHFLIPPRSRFRRRRCTDNVFRSRATGAGLCDRGRGCAAEVFVRVDNNNIIIVPKRFANSWRDIYYTLYVITRFRFTTFWRTAEIGITCHSYLYTQYT